MADAINNFWELRTNNPDRRVKFRFLTRSKIGMEQGNPFGKDKRGLELWQRCSSRAEAITKISDFLQTEDKISDEVKDFLKQAAPKKSINNSLNLSLGKQAANPPVMLSNPYVNIWFTTVIDTISHLLMLKKLLTLLSQKHGEQPQIRKIVS